MLTVERAREALDYNPETGIFTWRITAGRGKKGARAGTVNPSGYRIICIDGNSVREHRLAWLMATGKWPQAEIDHIDLNRTNNALGNLREATRGQNTVNRNARAASGLKGVRWRQSGKNNGKWLASITVKDGSKHKYKYLGSFDTREEAHEAFMRAHGELWGEFSRS